MVFIPVLVLVLALLRPSYPHPSPAPNYQAYRVPSDNSRAESTYNTIIPIRDRCVINQNDIAVYLTTQQSAVLRYKPTMTLYNQCKNFNPTFRYCVEELSACDFLPSNPNAMRSWPRVTVGQFLSGNYMAVCTQLSNYPTGLVPNVGFGGTGRTNNRRICVPSKTMRNYFSARSCGQEICNWDPGMPAQPSKPLTPDYVYG